MLHPRFHWMLIALFTSVAWAQSLEVAGVVKTKDGGEPVPGTVVGVKGTTLSAVTNASGSFKLSIPKAPPIVVTFSFIGFRPEERTLDGSNTNLEVLLEQAPLEVSEQVVITGFATSVKRQNLANSVASLTAEQIERTPSQTLDGALSGKFAGVTVSQNSGAPGGGISVNLRGSSTINGSSQPLYVIDGVIISNAEIQSGVNEVTQAAAAGSRTPQDQPTSRTADLVPGDIESIEVLKGPSAAALYGAKASNGVIIITTKKGRAGETTYSFNQSFGQRSISKKLGTRRFTLETAIATFGDRGRDLFDPNVFIDYEDEIYGETGNIIQTDFNARGGNEKTTFLFSGSALDDRGIIERTGYEKYSVRMNLAHNFNERLSVGLNTNVVNSTSDRGLFGNDNSGATIGVSLSSTPSFFDIRPVDGVYPSNPFAASNAIQTRDLIRNRETVDRTIFSTKLDFNVFQNASQTLDFNITAGTDKFGQDNDARFPNALQFEAASGQPGRMIVGTTSSRNSNAYFNLTHTYNTTDWMFRTTGGLQFEESHLDNQVTIGRGLIEGQFNLDQASAIDVNHRIAKQRDRGYFVQEEVNFGEAVFFTLGVRGDSSSTNGDETKYYTYPKSSISVRLSEYDFWKNLKPVVKEFKVRTAWGQTGNLPVPYAKYTSFGGININGQIGVFPGTLRGNPNIEPETSQELEFGFDATLWDGMATVEYTYFKQDISDLLLFRDIAPSTGFSQEAINGGEMETKGHELGINLNPIRDENWNWIVGVNWYTNESLVTKLDVPAYNTGGFADFLGRYRIAEGWSPTSIIGAERTSTGDFVKLGDETPDYQLGIDNSLNYRNWTLSFLLDVKEGGEVINLTRLLTDLGGTSADLDTQAAQDRLNNIGVTTSQFVEDGSYVKLRELKLEYELSKGMLGDILFGKLSHLRFGFSGRNLKTWTDYSGYDPEVSNFGSVSIGRSVDVTPFPSSKSYYFTISAGM